MKRAQKNALKNNNKGGDSNMGTMNKLTKIVLSFLMVITCINFSTVQAEDGEEVNYSEPTTVETVSEDPANEVEQEVAQEEPAVEEEATVEEAPAEQPAEEAAPVEEPQQEEVAPEASEEAQVEEVNNAPEESQEEATEEPAEVQKATVEISYVDEEDKEIADKVSDKEFDVDFVVTADDKEVYKDIDGYTFKEAIVNDDAENRTFTADTIKLDGLKVTSDMNKVKLVYSKNPVTTKKDTTVKKTSKKSSGLLGALEKAVDTLTEKTEEASDDADPLSTSDETRLKEFFVVADRNTVTVGDKAKVSVTIKPDDYPNKDVTWATSDSAVAEVDTNGVVTTKKVGTVTITATLKSDETVTSFTTIVVEDVKVNKITITGYTQKYLEEKDTVNLGTTIEPKNAANKDIIWSSSNPEVATVNQNGEVTAVAQGTTTITAKNEVSGVYGTQKITVYKSTPYKATVNVWVTNQDKNVSYNFYVAEDGTVVNVSDIKQNTKNDKENYISKGNIRVIPTLSGSANWADIQAYPIVQAFRYSEDQLQYTTDGTTWGNLNGYSIYDFSAMQYDSKYSGAFNKSDIAVTIGDWPYGATQATYHTRQTIQIVMLDTEHNNTEIYNSGKMRYDNGSSGEYGKINFNSENSKYEVTKVEVYNGSKLINTYENGAIPSDLSVSFSSQATNHYVIKAYATAKRINVSYVAEGAEENTIPKATTVKTIEKVTVAAQVPEKEGYIFVGWQYNGRTYRGGDSLEASSSDIEFKASFVEASEVINYTVNDSSMGSVSRTYERVGKTVTSAPVGSTAIAKTGHKFVKWMNADGEQVSTEVKFVPENNTPTTYTAVFEKIQSNLTIHYKDEKGNTIRRDEIKKLSYGESWKVEAPDIQGYTKPSETEQTGTMGVKDEEITFTYTKKVGKVVYNLGPKGSWGNGDAPENTAIIEAAKGKWAYTYGFDKGDTFVVTDKVPVSSDNAAFVGWYDKKRDDQPAAMRTAGSKLTYPYTTSSKTNSYTLDALWEKLGGKSNEVTYDGNSHRLEEFTVVFANDNLQGWTDSASSLVQASNIQYRLKQDNREANEWGDMPSFTDAGTYTIEARATVNEVVLTAEATLTINPRPVTVAAENKTKVYGTADPALTAKVSGTIGNDTVAYDVARAEGEAVGTYTITASGEAAQGNYTVTYTPGTFEITKAETLGLTAALTGEAASKVYDGEALANGATPSVTEGTTVSYRTKTAEEGEWTEWTDEVPSLTNVGKLWIEAKADNSNYKTVTVEYDLEVTPRTVKFTSATDSKPYDGTPLTNENVSVSGDGFAEGEGATFAVIGTITNVGTKANTFGYALNKNTLASNYNISTELGTLTITPKSIIPDGPKTPEDKKTGITVENPKDVKYDGKDHAEKPVIKDEKTGVTLEEGKDYEIVYPEDIKNAGEITATVVGNGDYEGSFEIKYNILKRDVTFTSATDSKQYDGNALTNGNVEITGDGFIEGEGATFNVTGSITDVGSTNNAFTYAMNEGTNADNYNVTVVEGTLTVSEQPVVPTPATPTTPSNNTPARTNNVPARVVTNPTTTTPAPEATVEPEKAETTPAPTAKPEKIKEEATPQAAPKGHWALINLIAAMLSVVLAVVALLAKHAKDEDDEDKDDQVVANENEDDENESTRHRRWKVIATIDAILAVVVFILTENLAHDMVLVDKWTLLMVLFGLISIVSTYFARKWHEEDEDEDEESSQNA